MAALTGYVDECYSCGKQAIATAVKCDRTDCAMRPRTESGATKIVTEFRPSTRIEPERDNPYCSHCTIGGRCVPGCPYK